MIIYILFYYSITLTVKNKEVIPLLLYRQNMHFRLPDTNNYDGDTKENGISHSSVYLSFAGVSDSVEQIVELQVTGGQHICV